MRTHVPIQPRITTHKNEDPRRLIGLGQNASADAVIAAIRSAVLTDVYNMPTVAKVQWEFAGPITPKEVQQTLGDTINILGSSSNPPPGVDEVFQTAGLQNGEFQRWIAACHFAVHLEYSSECFAARGNAFASELFPTPGAKPFSPDAWTQNDLTSDPGWAGSTGPLAPADLDYGTPAGNAFWAMVRGYNFRWMYGAHVNIIDEQLRESAYMPPNPQMGSASSSLIWLPPYAREVNDRYAAKGAIADFAVVDTLRVGSVGAFTYPATGTNTGRFVPSRDFEYVPVTYGGPDLRSKIGIGENDEFRSLSNARMLRPGVSIGMQMESRNAELVSYFQSQFNINAFTSGAISATAPPIATEDGDFVVGFGTVFQEQTIDAAIAQQKVFSGRAYYKGFRALMSNEIKGWELEDNIADMINRDPAAAAKLCSSCGCLAWGS